MAEAVRAGRFLNVILGLWVVLSPWVLEGATGGGRWNAAAVGLLIALLSLRRGVVRERSGSWDAAIV